MDTAPLQRNMTWWPGAVCKLVQDVKLDLSTVEASPHAAQKCSSRCTGV